MHWQLEHIIWMTGIKPNTSTVLIGLSAAPLGLQVWCGFFTHQRNFLSISCLVDVAHRLSTKYTWQSVIFSVRAAVWDRWPTSPSWACLMRLVKEESVPLLQTHRWTAGDALPSEKELITVCHNCCVPGRESTSLTHWYIKVLERYLHHNLNKYYTLSLQTTQNNTGQK